MTSVVSSVKPAKPLTEFELEWRARAYLVGIDARELNLDQLRAARAVAEWELQGRLRKHVMGQLDAMIRHGGSL